MRLVPVIVSLALLFVAAAAPLSAQPVETPAAEQPNQTPTPEEPDDASAPEQPADQDPAPEPPAETPAPEEPNPMPAPEPPSPEPEPPAREPVETKPPEKEPEPKPADKATDARPAKPSVLSRFRGHVRRLRVHVNAGSQVTSHDMVAQGAFPLYLESATFEVRGETGSGAVIDVGAAYPLRRRFVGGELFGGLSYSRVGGDLGGPLSGQVPHPLIFDSPRPISGSVSGLDHVEHAIHFQAVWLHPISNRIEIALSAGPTLFIVSQDLVSAISLTEAGSSVSLAGTTIQNVNDNAAGFNVGMDGSYRLTRRLAVGAFVRYAGGSVDLPAASGNVSLDVGGVQVGAGVRLRFR
jgi:hypothetical protein